MTLIESMAQLEAFIDRAEELQTHSFSNLYLFEDDVVRLIGQRRLFYEIDGTSLYLYSDEGANYQLYFYTDKPVCARHFEKPLVCEVLYREGNDEEILKIQKLLNEFRVNKTSAAYVFRIKDKEQSLCVQYEETKRVSVEKQIHVRDASEKDLCVLKELWSYLDPLDSKYISPEELESAFLRQEITVAQNSETGVCGTNWRTKTGHTSLHKQLAVSANMRGQGIGRLLVLEGLMQDLKEGTPVQSCWLDINNEATLRLHKDIGFVPVNKRSMQFTK